MRKKKENVLYTQCIFCENKLITLNDVNYMNACKQWIKCVPYHDNLGEDCNEYVCRKLQTK